MTGEQANGPTNVQPKQEFVKEGETKPPPVAYKNTIAQYFGCGRPPTEQDVQNRMLCHDVLNEAYRNLEKILPPGPETTTCFRKLLEAKDCAMRAAAPNAY